MSQQKFSLAFLFCFFVAVFSFLCLICSGSLDSEDGWLYASVARNIYYHHQVASAPNEYPDLNVHMNMQKGADGVWRAPGSFGYSLSLVPAVFLSDLVHQAYHVPPPEHFPLQTDWSFHLFASFTNAFYGALLAVILLKYAQELGFSQKFSVVISLLTLGTTSLLPLTKFSFAHMMFISFLMMSFYSIKRFGTTQKLRYLIYSALAFGVVAITYNETFTLSIIPLGIYLLIYETPKQRRITLLLGFLGGITLTTFLLIIHSSFLNLIFSTIKVSPKILFEGVWGFLLSPGKSIFLYSPALIIIPIYWHKIRKGIRPELIASIVLTFCYLYVLGSASITKLGMQQGIWHGGMNWGTRYIAPLIPLWMFIVFHIVQLLKPIQKKFIVIPLFIWGAWIQLVGVSTSYLLQYVDLPYNFFIGKTEIQVYDYASFIPRYTPILTLSKQFVKITLDTPKTILKGKYQVMFFDGFDVPYKTTIGTFRGFRDQGYVQFSNDDDKPKVVDLDLFNAPDSTISAQVAIVSENINGKDQPQIFLPPDQLQHVTISLNDIPISDKNKIIFKVNYAAPLLNPQVVYIRKMVINSNLINLSSLDYPDMSDLGKVTTSIPYQYSGKIITDNWVFWQTRARINERTLDFWWMKNFYFWDRPKEFIWILALLNISIFSASSYLVIKTLSEKKPK